MNLKQLEHLVTLAETGSFSRAAEKLFITQSALSRSIQSLEDALGGKLLDRIGKRNAFTPLGLEVAARARQIVRDTAELLHSAQLLQGTGAAALNLGLGSGPAALLMQPLMLSAAQTPGTRLGIAQGAVELLMQQLRARHIDAMVVDMRRVVPAADLQIEALPELSAGFFVRAGHPLAGKKRVGIDDVLQFPVASTPLSDEVARQLVSQYGPQANPADMLALRCDDVASLVHTVLHSDAIFLGVHAATRMPQASGALQELPLQPALAATAQFACVTLAGRTESVAVARLRTFVREQMGQQVQATEPKRPPNAAAPNTTKRPTHGTAL